VAKWTVMIFMGAEGVEGNLSLEREADADIAELKQIPSSSDLEIWVERHGAGVADRFRVEKNNLVPEEQPAFAPESFASGAALESFIHAATSTYRGEPDHYTMLVLWGHAYDFAFAPVETRFGIDALDFAELANVLKGSKERKPKSKSHKLDIVAFDACALATIEVACQLEPFARFLLASQIGVPLPGWPYTAILGRLAKPEGDRIMGPAELGAYAVRRYCEHYRALERPVTLTHLELSHADDLVQLTDRLARELIVSMDDNADEISTINQLFRSAQTAPGQPFVDVLDLCAQLVRDSCSDEVRAAALALGDSLLSPTGEGPKASAQGLYQPFIVENGRNSCECAGLHGVSLYAPNVADDHDVVAAASFYGKFSFADRTVWPQLVRALALTN